MLGHRGPIHLLVTPRRQVALDLAADCRVRPTELAPNRTQRQTLNPSSRNELPLLETQTLPRHPHHLRSSHQSTGAMTGRIQASVLGVPTERPSSVTRLWLTGSI